MRRCYCAIRKFLQTRLELRIVKRFFVMFCRLPNCIVDKYRIASNSAVKLRRMHPCCLFMIAALAVHVLMNSSTSSAFTVNLFIKITGVTFSSFCVKSFTFSSVSMSLFEPLLLCPDVICGDSLPMFGPT